MRYGILGPLEVWTDDGEPVDVGGPRQRSLLVVLAAAGGEAVSADRLIELQYGDRPPAEAGNALQAQISRLRRRLPPGAIRYDGGYYRLAADRTAVDAIWFSELAADGRRRLAAGDWSGAVEVLSDALALWRGAALDDLERALPQAERWNEERMTATEDLIEAELALPAGTSVARLQALAVEHPLRERLHGQLIRALHAAGRQADALTTFDQLRSRLADELGADPSPELTAIQLSVLRAEPLPRLRPRALPRPLTTFLGRTSELERVADAARSTRSSLLTVVGPGGIGKTRLVLEAVRGVDDAVFVDLAAVGPGGSPAVAVLSALGEREATMGPGPAQDPTRRLVAVLSDRPVLVLLDNCEHLVEPVAVLLGRLLAGCSGVRIIATSRVALGVPGEDLLTLMPLPTGGDASTGGDLAPAMALFLDRAGSAGLTLAAGSPSSRPDAPTEASVTAICAAVDGLPLAIELAAARVRQFGLAELTRRLTGPDRNRLLVGADRTATPRHRTLDAVVRWSWDLLTAAEQTVARRISVFSGGALLPDLEAVCALPDTDLVIAGLVDQSLVRIEDGRYQMLQTVRLFAAAELAAAGEEEAIRRSHAARFLWLADEADPHLRTADQLDWLARLRTDDANLSAALAWAAEHDLSIGMRLVAALATYWWFTGRRSAAGSAASALLRRLEENAAGPDAIVPAGLEEEYVSCVAHAIPTATPSHWARAALIMETTDRRLRHPFGAARWGLAAGPPREVGDPHRLLEDDPWNRALARLSSVLLGILGGRPDLEEPEMRAALDGFSALGERWGSAQALDWLAVLAGWRGEWERAEALWERSLDLLSELGAREESADVLANRADARLRRGDHGGAAADLQRMAGLLAGQDVAIKLSLGRARLARLAGDHDHAGVWVERAAAVAPVGAHRWTVAAVQVERGRLASARGDAAGALRRHREAVRASIGSPFLADLAMAAEGLAGAVGQAGDAAQEARLLGAAVALRGVAVAGDPDVAASAAHAAGLLGPERFAACYADAVAMSTDAARDLVVALADEGDSRND